MGGEKAGSPAHVNSPSHSGMTDRPAVSLLCLTVSLLLIKAELRRLRVQQLAPILSVSMATTGLSACVLGFEAEEWQEEGEEE